MSEFDPFAAIEADRQRRAQEAAQRELEERRAADWQAAWQGVWTDLGATSLHQLGVVLRERECGFWLNYLDVAGERSRLVLEQGLLRGYVLDTNAAAHQVVALRLLRAAYEDDGATVLETLLQIRTTGIKRGVGESLVNLRNSLNAWISGQHPSTPYLSRSELAAALRRRIKGYGTKSSINKNIAAGVMVIEMECEPAADGKTRYACFRHRDNAVHAEILRHCVTFLYESRKT